MKALSIRQPWAWLIVSGLKDIENRSWATGHRGRLLIHAGQTVDREALVWLRQTAAEQGIAIPESFPTGGIVGEATMVDCVTASDSEWFDGPFGFVLADARQRPFRPYKGRLGLFDVD